MGTAGACSTPLFLQLRPEAEPGDPGLDKEPKAWAFVFLPSSPGESLLRMELCLPPSPNAYIEALIPTVIAFGARAFEQIIKVK